LELKQTTLKTFLTITPEKAIRVCEQSLGTALPQKFKEIISAYAQSNGGTRWDIGWADDLITKHYVRENISDVKYLIVAENYLGFRSRDSIYVFGITEDGRLFINKINMDLRIDDDNTVDGELVDNIICKLPDGTGIYLADDEYFRTLFGFSTFTHGSTIHVGRETLSGLRLQGEIVADVAPLGVIGWEGFKELTMKRFERSLQRYVAYLVLDMVYGILLDCGITAQTDPFGNDILIVNGITVSDIIRRREAVLKMFERYFQVIEAWDNDADDPKLANFYIKAASDALGEFIIGFESNPIHQWRHFRMVVWSWCLNGSQLAAKLTEEFRRRFEESWNPQTRISFWIGNHRITLSNFITRSIAFTPDHEPIFFEKRPIKVTVNPTWVECEANEYEESRGYRFISLEGATIRLEHKEHGVREIGVEPYCILRLRTTWSSHDFIERRNIAALEALYEEYMKAANSYKHD
jgi:hypothetical protein